MPHFCLETRRKRQTVGLYIAFVTTSRRLALRLPFNMVLVVSSIAQAMLSYTPWRCPTHEL